MTPRPRGGVPLRVTPRHMRMAHAVLARRGFYESTTVDYDDHVGACLLGLAKAAKRWNPAGGASFEAYAYNRMLGEHLDYMRTLDHLTRSERARVKSGETEDPGPPVLELVARRPRASSAEAHESQDGLYESAAFADPVDDYETLALADAIEGAVDTLTDREAVVVRLCGLRDWRQVDVAVLLDVCESRVTQINASARRKLRGRLGPLLRDAA